LALIEGLPADRVLLALSADRQALAASRSAGEPRTANRAVPALTAARFPLAAD
jgi:hypothetical protein